MVNRISNSGSTQLSDALILLKRLMGNYTRQPWPQETVELWRDRLIAWIRAYGFGKVSYAIDRAIEEEPELKGIAVVRQRIDDRIVSSEFRIVPPPGETLESMRENFLEFGRIWEQAVKDYNERHKRKVNQ